MNEKCAECERVENLQKERDDGTDGGEKDKIEEAVERPQFRAVEGMDPETGNFIRIQKQRDEEQRDDGTQRDQYSANIVLDPTKLSVSPKTDEKGTWTGQNSQGQWSRRFASTMTNRSRSEVVDEDDQSEGEGGFLLGGQIRFTVMIVCTLCLSSILSNILAFNFTYICMAGERPENFTELEQKNVSFAKWEENEWKELGYNPNLDYSSQQRSMLFMAVAVGALITVFPLTVLLNRFGSRLVFGSLGFISAIATLLLPLSANLGFPFILGIRIIQGVLFHTHTIPPNASLSAPLSPRVSRFLQIAPIFTMPISGALCTSSVGWPSVYYLHGIVSLLLFTFFMLYHRNSPTKHPMMDRAELVKVLFGKGSIYSGPGQQNKRKGRRVPLRAFYSDKAIWAILVASFGNFMGTQLSLQFMPTYINKVLHMPIENTGLASAISPVIMFFIKLLAGQSSDRIKFIDDRWKLRIYNTLSMGMMGVLFIVLAFLDPITQPSLCLFVLIASTCILGFNSGGFFKSSQMVSRQHSHFTLANISFLNCVCMLLTPLLNEVIASDNAPSDWAIVLLIHGLTLCSTNAFFCVFASAKGAPWALETAKTKPTRKKRMVTPTAERGEEKRGKGNEEAQT
ncbi:hypothetical protein niasHT_013477 [Heterodera trifolii]|uniref:Major facilitator superfamily (MFS) profile domain-containing protein n=1 Tax=Heterodera trifolii TaxID=157864 RepID=A0ABD2LCQ3_9BILA